MFFRSRPWLRVLGKPFKMVTVPVSCRTGQIAAIWTSTKMEASRCCFWADRSRFFFTWVPTIVMNGVKYMGPPINGRKSMGFTGKIPKQVEFQRGSKNEGEMGPPKNGSTGLVTSYLLMGATFHSLQLVDSGIWFMPFCGFFRPRFALRPH